MTARVINDPSALGWEYDPDTGRWTWGGHSSSGGGGGGSFPEAPVDGEQYARQNAGWSVVEHPEGGTGGGTVTTADVQLTNPTTFMPSGMETQEDANAYIEGELQKIIPDANADGTIYGRQNNAWVAVPSGGGGDVDLTGYATETWVSANYQVKGNYLTSSSLNGYATQTWVSSNYQPKGNYLTSESDPTVPSWVKSITQNDINNWNSSSGGGDPFPWNGSQAEFISTRNGENIKITAGGSRGPEILLANTGGGANNKSIRAAGGKLEVVNGAYSAVIFSCADDGIVTATDFIATSDRKKKDHIETAPTGVIEKLRGVTFQWKDTGRESAGVIAQELQDAGLGHLVHEDDDGLSVAYAGLTAYLIEEIKLLKSEIEALK